MIKNKNVVLNISEYLIIAIISPLSWQKRVKKKLNHKIKHVF